MEAVGLGVGEIMAFGWGERVEEARVGMRGDEVGVIESEGCVGALQPVIKVHRSENIRHVQRVLNVVLHLQPAYASS